MENRCNMKKLLSLASRFAFLSLAARFPILSASIVFLVVAVPINHLFLGDRPNNPLEQAEEIVIEAVTGVHVDLNSQK